MAFLVCQLYVTPCDSSAPGHTLNVWMQKNFCNFWHDEIVVTSTLKNVSTPRVVILWRPRRKDDHMVSGNLAMGLGHAAYSQAVVYYIHVSFVK